MVTTVIIPPSLGGTGTPYNDGTGPFGMFSNSGYGYTTYLYPALSEVVAAIQVGVNAATTAVNAPGTSGTSATSLTIGLGTKTFNTQAGKNWVVGQPVVVAMTAAPTNWMAGPITAYDSGTGAMTVQTSAVNGSGTAAAWSISLSGPVVPTTGRLIGTQVITATGTYTPTTGTASVVVEIVGGGGAGGGVPATIAGQVAAGCGGSAGGYAKSRITAGFANVTVTIGAGGVPVSGTNGGNGGTSSFGALLSGTGGSGGVAGAAVGGGGTLFVTPSAGGAGSSGNIVNIAGQPGGLAFYGSTAGVGGTGGSSVFGTGAAPSFGAPASSSGFGAGGGGAANGASLPARTGGAGTPGACIIWEYA